MSHSIPNPSPLKVCTRCLESKPLSEFPQYRSGKRAGKYFAYCIKCNAERIAQARKENPEHHHAIAERTREKNRERRNAEQREKWVNDAEYRNKRLDKARRWRDRNRDHIFAYSTESYRKNTKFIRQRQRENSARYPERLEARHAVNYAVLSGLFPPAWTMVCDRCQEAQARDYHHHNGYGAEHRLDVIPLCTRCHGISHWRQS